MATAAELALHITARDDASKVIANVGKEASGLGKTLGDVGKIAGGFLAANVIAGGAEKVLGFFNDSVNAAKDLGESVNAVNKIFGDSAGQILDWGKNNATQFGLSQRAFNQLATPLGAMLRNTGMSMEDVTTNTIELTKRAADMASVFNVDVDEALTAIQAGLRGESDPLERFGVGLSAAKVEARALADTGKETAAALTDQEKATARLAILFEQTAAVAGDFAGTSDELANKTRIQQARQEELAATIGEKLIPVQLALTEAKLALVTVIAEKVLPILSPLIENTIQLAGAFFNVVKTGELFEDFGSDFPAWMQPILLKIGEIAVFIHHDLIPAFNDVVAFVRDHWPEISAVIAFAADYVITRIEGMIQVIRSIIEIVTSTVNLVSAIFHGDWARAWEEMKDIASAIIDLFVGYIRMQFGNLPEIILEAIGDLGSLLFNAGRDLVQGFIDGIKSKAGDVANAITGLPGNIVSGLIPGRQHGGPVLAGRPYIVGEAGPELFVPRESGAIVPGAGMAANFYGPVTIVANNPRQLMDQLSELQAHQLRLAQRGI